MDGEDGQELIGSVRGGAVAACVAALALGGGALWLLGRDSGGERLPEESIGGRGESVTIEQAEIDLALLNSRLGSRKSRNEDLIASIDAVLGAYRSLKPPEMQLEADRKAWDARVAAFRKDAEKLFLDALTVIRLTPNATSNEREEVNVEAARALATTGNAGLSKKIRGEIETKLWKAKYPVTSALWDAVFGALGTLSDPDTLVWYQDMYVHTKNSPPTEVDQLAAAHKSIPLFKLKDASGAPIVSAKLRHDLAKSMITPYSSTESAAEQSNRNPRQQAQREFWQRVGPSVIRAVQFLCGDPVDAHGSPIDTMRGFLNWLRDHDDPRKPPWNGPR